MTGPAQGDHGPSAVSLAQVSVRIGRRTVLEGIDLQVPRATIMGVLGPNGAGKSTLLHALTGLRAASSGTVTVLGLPAGRRGAAGASRLGVVLQETALYDELSARENLAFFAELYAVADPGRAVDEALALLGLGAQAAQRVGTLSGGMRRRIAIARALLHAPEILVVDEPTLGVDAEARHAIWTHLRRLRARGATVIVATNYLDEALALCDRVAILRDGRIAAVEAPTTLVARIGSCIDIDCAEGDVATVTAALGDLRVQPAPAGITVFIAAGTAPDTVVERARAIARVTGYRQRGADLAEIFRQLGPADARTGP